MQCPFCAALDNRVIDSRLSQAGEVIRRRRECDKCSKRYTTYERVERALPMVIKKNDQREPFDREKLLAGLQRACVKRPVTADMLERVLDDVERNLSEQGGSEVRSSEIGEIVLEALREIDAVAYVRFASVYRDFQNVGEFVQLLSNLTSHKKSA